MKSLGEMQWLTPPRGSSCRRPLGAWSLAVALALGAPMAGCSSGHDAMQKDLETLRGEVARLRTTTTVLQDRLDAVEERGPAGATSASKESGPGDRPVLEVVTLTPQDEPGAPVAAVQEIPSPDDGAPRPVIVGDEQGVEQLAEGEVQETKPGGQGARKSTRGGR
jgi:hypothetical protein